MISRSEGKAMTEPEKETLMRRRINDRIVELHRARPLSEDDAETLASLQEMQASVLGGVARPARGMIVTHTRKRRFVDEGGSKERELTESEFRALRAEAKRQEKRKKRVKVRDMVVGAGLERKPKRQRRARLHGVLLALLALLAAGCVRVGTFPGATAADRAACRMVARQLSCLEYNALGCDSARTRQYNDCMTAKGLERDTDAAVQPPASRRHRG